MNSTPLIKKGDVFRISYSGLDLRNSVLYKTIRVGKYTPGPNNYTTLISGKVIYPEAEVGKHLTTHINLVQVVPENLWRPLVEGKNHHPER